MLCANVSYKASFEAGFVDLECLEKHSILTVLLENSRNHHDIACFSINSQKGFSTWAHFLTVYHRPMAGLNGFKVIKLAAITKLIITTST